MSRKRLVAISFVILALASSLLFARSVVRRDRQVPGVPIADRLESASLGVSAGTPPLAGSAGASAFPDPPPDPVAAMGEEIIEDPCESRRTLSLKNPPMKGEDVEEYRQALARLGFEPGPVNRAYDRRMKDSVAAFQRAHRLPVNGKIDEATQRALASAFEPEHHSSTAPAEAPPPSRRTTRVLISLYTHELTVLVDGKPFRTFPVAVGKGKTRSPIGEWKIVHKGIWGNGFGTRWMGLSVPWGTYGIHGTNKPWTIGSAASHGCFRMFNRHVEEVYSLVSIGTPVDIVGDLFLFNKTLPGTYRKGSCSQGVVTIQLRLRQLGFLNASADGSFGQMTEDAVKAFQRLNGLPDNGVVDSAVKKKLNL